MPSASVHGSLSTLARPVSPGLPTRPDAPCALAQARRVDGRALCLARALGRRAESRRPPPVARARSRRPARVVRRRAASRSGDDGDGSGDGPGRDLAAPPETLKRSACTFRRRAVRAPAELFRFTGACHG